MTAIALPNLQSVQGNVRLLAQTSLTAVNFPALTNIGGDLELNQSVPEMTLTMDNLVQIGGHLTLDPPIGADTISALILPALQTVNAITIRHTRQLSDLDLPALTEITEFGAFLYNDQLPSCQIENILSQLTQATSVGVTSNRDLCACDEMSGAANAF